MNTQLENIISKAGELYQTNGVRSVTMDDLASELGISKKTLYNFVRDKEDLIRKVCELDIKNQHCFREDIYDKGLNAIDQMMEVLKQVMLDLKRINPATVFDVKKYYPEIYDEFFMIRRNNLYEWISKNIEQGKQEGLYREAINTDIITRLQVQRIEGIASGTILKIEEFIQPQIFFEVFEYHVRGMATEKGIEILETKLKEILK